MIVILSFKYLLEAQQGSILPPRSIFCNDTLLENDSHSTRGRVQGDSPLLLLLLTNPSLLASNFNPCQHFRLSSAHPAKLTLVRQAACNVVVVSVDCYVLMLSFLRSHNRAPIPLPSCVVASCLRETPTRKYHKVASYLLLHQMHLFLAHGVVMFNTLAEASKSDFRSVRRLGVGLCLSLQTFKTSNEVPV